MSAISNVLGPETTQKRSISQPQGPGQRRVTGRPASEATLRGQPVSMLGHTFIASAVRQGGGGGVVTGGHTGSGWWKEAVGMGVGDVRWRCICHGEFWWDPGGEC